MGKHKIKNKSKMIDKNKIKEALREAKEIANQHIQCSSVSAVDIYNKKKVKKITKEKWEIKETSKNV